MAAEKQYLILVDDKDRPWGKMEKLETHQAGLLHRAFSVFIFNSKGELLLQQRAQNKYHSGNLWTNTCCSHPEYGEDLTGAIKRRLLEEMGLTVETTFAFSFIYKIKFENGLTEREFDHVYIGISDDVPHPDKNEVSDYKYENIDFIRNDLLNNPDEYTAWFKLCFEDVISNKIVADILEKEK